MTPKRLPAHHSYRHKLNHNNKLPNENLFVRLHCVYIYRGHLCDILYHVRSCGRLPSITAAQRSSRIAPLSRYSFYFLLFFFFSILIAELDMVTSTPTVPVPIHGSRVSVSPSISKHIPRSRQRINYYF